MIDFVQSAGVNDYIKMLNNIIGGKLDQFVQPERLKQQSRRPAEGSTAII